MEPHEEIQEFKFHKLEKIVEEHEFSQTDVEKLMEKNCSEISDAAKELLQKEKPRKEKEYTQKSKKEPKKDERENEKPVTTQEEIEHFLRERSLSQSFVATFLKIGFTEEIRRFLYALGLNCEDTEELRRLWDQEIKNRDESDSFVSLPSSSNEYLSSDGLFLKYCLSKPLSHALREVIMKKPFDPVEYLGHWLLNYKICEEREKVQKEFELELMIERERLKRSDGEEEIPMPIGEEGEEEEFMDTQSFSNDE